jgi:ankyrin repeat protein
MTLTVALVGVAASRPLTEVEVATLRAVPMDTRTAEFRAQQALAQSLGKEQNADAIPVLLELRQPHEMRAFVDGYQARGVLEATPDMEALALRLAHDPSYGRDEAGWETRSEFYRLLIHYQSRELFDLFYASVQRELNARKRGDRGLLPLEERPLSERSLSGSLMNARITGVEEPIAALLPLMTDACQGYPYLPYLRRQRYLAAFERVRDLYVRMGISNPGCDREVTATIAMSQSRAASAALVQRARWLLAQPAGSTRDAELLEIIGSLGGRTADAQVDLAALSREFLAAPMSPELHSKLTSGFDAQMEVVSHATQFTADNLHHWIDLHALDLVRSFLAHGVDANSPDARGETPLVRAARVSDLEIATALVEAGADVNRPDSQRDTPLIVACGGAPGGPHAGDLPAYLLAHGALVTAADAAGLTAMHAAARWGKSASIDALLAAGADIEVRAGRRHLANGSPDPADLVFGGAPFAGATPLHVAANQSMTETAEHLVERGAKVNARLPSGGTPLLLAVAFKNPALARFLIEHGADVNIAANGGLTPVIMAHENGDAETERLLWAHGALLNPITLATRAAARAVLEQIAAGMK